MKTLLAVISLALLVPNAGHSQEGPPQNVGDVFQKAQEYQKSKEFKDQFAPGGPNDPKTAVSEAMKVLGQQKNSGPVMPSPSGGVDVKALIEQATRSDSAQAYVKGMSKDRLIVFVSFSMPGVAMQRMLLASNKAGGTTVLRGFKNDSLEETKAALMPLIQGGGHDISISPSDFKRYGVKVVPAVVIAKDDTPDGMCASNKCDPSEFAMVTGDVSLDYALEYIERESPQFAPLASKFLAKLRGAK